MILLREIQHKSVWPVYIAAGVFALYALIFPLYSLTHFLIAALVTAAAWLAGDRIFKPVTEYIPVEEPAEVSYGERVDAILAENARVSAELRRLSAGIMDEAVRAKIARLDELGGKIAEQAKCDGVELASIEKFQAYFPPTTLRLLESYTRMAAVGREGENLSGSLAGIEQMLDTEIDAYARELDSLFRSEALDIDTEIRVMNSMLEREGLAGESELDTMVRQAAETQREAEQERARRAAEEAAAAAAREAETAAAAARKADEFRAAEELLHRAARGELAADETKKQ